MITTVILAGGKGARLRPYTTVLPKPLMPVGEYPILEIMLRQLARHGVRDVFIAVGYLAHLIEALFKDGAELGLNIEYSHEEEPLGTAGPLGLLLNKLSDDVLVLNGDLLTDLDYPKLVEFHRSSGASATIAVRRRDIFIDFGIIEHTEDLELSRYVEKPTHRFLVSMGAYVFKTEALKSHLSPGKSKDIPALIQEMHRNGVKVMCSPQTCHWLDIGRVDDYQMALNIFEQNKSRFLGEE